ncbi:response regulator [Neosynechococcus sphagnicola]|uniref:response regulator n=1 Tax=Neosynechococcus sphagnicola TaxID=1501145 RepID=UPI000691E2B8|nr:response regulator [Neosynechococcus sphagnicola]
MQLRFAVKDTGIGPRDRLQRLFQSFSQVDSSITRKYGGTGLGLAISKHLCEMMQGTIGVESQVGQGSTFWFTILTHATPDPDTSESVIPPLELAGKRLLIVDANTTNCQILTLQTQSWGMFPQSVHSGTEALEQLSQQPDFDLSIVEMLMPDIEGAALVTALRQHPKGQNLPIVMLISLGQQHRQVLDQVKASAYLLKPVKQAQLMSTLSRALHSCEISLEAESSFQPSLQSLMPEPLSLRVLLAEDNAVNQKLGLLMLQRLGCRADVAANGLEVLESLHRQPYDLILMDVQMPEMDGLEATEQIHQQWAAPSRPWIIAMTANAMKGDRERCLAAGMDDYISKPVRIEDLDQVLRRYQSREVKPKIEESGTARIDSQSPTLNLKVLADLREMSGDDGEFLREIFDCFLVEVPPMIQLIQQAIAQGDAELLWQTAHKLKSTSAAIGATILAGQCAALEISGRNHTFVRSQETIEQLRAEYHQVECLINEQLNRPS